MSYAKHHRKKQRECRSAYITYLPITRLVAAYTANQSFLLERCKVLSHHAVANTQSLSHQGCSQMIISPQHIIYVPSHRLYLRESFQ